MSETPEQAPVQLPPVEVKPAGDIPPDEFGMLRSSPGFAPAMILLYEGMMARGDKVLLDYTRTSVGVRMFIDGIWHPGAERDRTNGDAMLMILKKFADLDPADRRGKQVGSFKAEHQKTKYTVNFTSQGVKTGERVLIELKKIEKDIPKLQDLGMRDKSVEVLKEWMTREKGLLLFSSPPDAGLRTTYRSALNTTDRFMRDFRSVEDKQSPEDEVINVEPEFYDSAAGENPTTHLRKLLLREPDVVCFPNMTDPETAAAACDAIKNNDQLVITRIRAKDCAEALLRFLMLKPDAEVFAESVIGVVNQRLIRKLCQCKEAYQPPPQLLQKLGIPAGRVSAFYREKQPLTAEQVRQLEEAKQPIPGPCPQCRQVCYFGRVAIFEMLEVNDAIRKALLKSPKVEILRKLAKEAGSRSFQDEAILQVALGETSLTEAQRALKS